MKYIEIYKKDRPTKVIDSKIYGLVTYYDWLCREKDRICQSPKRHAYVKGGQKRKGKINRHSDCCLMVNRAFGMTIK